MFRFNQALPSSLERNKRFLAGIIDNGDPAFTKLIEGLISNGQPFLGELLESEGNICFQSMSTTTQQ